MSVKLPVVNSDFAAFVLNSLMECAYGMRLIGEAVNHVAGTGAAGEFHTVI